MIEDPPASPVRPRRASPSARVFAFAALAVLSALVLLLEPDVLAWNRALHAHAGATARTAVRWGVVACFVYLVVLYGLYAVQLVFAAVDGTIRNRERRAEDFETLERSRFTIPVTVVSALYNEEPIVLASVRSLLAQSYPEFELVVVDDGSTDGTFEVLRREYDLRPLEIFYRRVIDAREVRSVHRSERDPRLLVVRKVNGGKADALNCGTNFARYRYVAGVDGDTVYRRDALLKGMRLAIRDPGRVVGVTSHVAISYCPEEANELRPGARRVDRSLLSNYQHIDYLRSFFNNRLAWSRLGFMLCTVGAFHLWRRDVLEEVGGFSTRFTCEDIELTFRVHEKYLREGRPYAILSLPDTVATTEGPSRVAALVKQRARWQRVIMETVWHYRRMLFNPRYRTVGLIGMPFYVVSELLAPLFELLSVITLVLALWLGVIEWLAFGLVLGAMALATAVLTSFAVLLEDATTRSYRLGSLVRLILAGPLELFLYRPILMWARARGAWDFFRGRRDWDKFERNPRPALGAAD